jgi:hypothetical protein
MWPCATRWCPSRRNPETHHFAHFRICSETLNKSLLAQKIEDRVVQETTPEKLRNVHSLRQSGQAIQNELGCSSVRQTVAISENATLGVRSQKGRNRPILEVAKS